MFCSKGDKSNMFCSKGDKSNIHLLSHVCPNYFVKSCIIFSVKHLNQDKFTFDMYRYVLLENLIHRKQIFSVSSIDEKLNFCYVQYTVSGHNCLSSLIFTNIFYIKPQFYKKIYLDVIFCWYFHSQMHTKVFIHNLHIIL